MSAASDWNSTDVETLLDARRIAKRGLRSGNPAKRAGAQGWLARIQAALDFGRSLAKGEE